MFSPSLKQMVLGRLREFQREPSAMVFVLTMPVLWMTILGFVFSDPKPPVYGVGLHNSVEESVVAQLRAMESFKISEADDVQGFVNPIRRGEIQVVVQFQEGQYVYQYDLSHPKGLEARRAVNESIQSIEGRIDVVPSQDVLRKENGSRYIDFLIPGLLALSLFTTSLFGTGMTIVASRRENILKRYRATPMKPLEYIISHILGRYIVSFVEFAVIMLSGFLLFDFQVLGSWFAFVLICVVGTAAFTALSILCGARTSNTAAYAGMNNLVTLPMMIFSGVWFSRGDFPGWLNAICDWLPLTPLVDGLRVVALEGGGLMDVQSQVLILALYAVAGALVTQKVFKWY